MNRQITRNDGINQEINLSNRRAAIGALVKARIHKKMTLLDASWVSGVSWDAVRSWEKGRREPTMGNLVAVAQSLGFEIILRPQGQITPPEPAPEPPTPAPATALKRKSRRKMPDPNQTNFLNLL